MVSEKRRAYMKEYMRRKRAKEKLLTVPESAPQYTVEKPEIKQPIFSVPEGCSPIGISNFNVCMHCRSKDISRKGNIVSCRRCGISYDLTKGFIQRVCRENEV